MSTGRTDKQEGRWGWGRESQVERRIKRGGRGEKQVERRREREGGGARGRGGREKGNKGRKGERLQAQANSQA